MRALPNDIWQLILSHTDDPWVFKRTYLTCQLFVYIYENYLPHLVRKYTNQLWILLELFPEHRGLYRNAISRNPNTTWELVQAFPNNTWDWDVLALHKNISLDTIENEPGNWCIKNIFCKSNLTWDYIQNHPDIEWNMFRLSANRAITLDIIVNNPHPDCGEWNWEGVSHNPNLTWEFVLNNMDKDWNWRDISRLPEITWDIVQEYSEMRWNYLTLSKNLNISWEIMMENSDKFCIDRNHNIYLRPDIPLNILLHRIENGGISLTNINITWEVVKDIAYTFSYNQRYELSRNPNITWDILENNSEYPWIMNGYSMNPNLTWEIVVNNPQPRWGKWNWNHIFSKIGRKKEN